MHVLSDLSITISIWHFEVWTQVYHEIHAQCISRHSFYQSFATWILLGRDSVLPNTWAPTVCMYMYLQSFPQLRMWLTHTHPVPDVCWLGLLDGALKEVLELYNVLWLVLYLTLLQLQLILQSLVLIISALDCVLQIRHQLSQPKSKWGGVGGMEEGIKDWQGTTANTDYISY